MTAKTPGPDPGAHLREQVRRIIIDEDAACLGVRLRPAIPLSDEERVALATLRRLESSQPFDPEPPPIGTGSAMTHAHVRMVRDMSAVVPANTAIGRRLDALAAGQPPCPMLGW